MREPNLCFPSQNRAAVCITSALYDRRALDCTATLPLVNSLTHLAYLTSTSPRIREILCLDGGLERLVRILEHSSSRSDRLTLWKWTLAFQTIVNIGVRGTEQIRTKVVEAGIIPFVLTILGDFSKTYESPIEIRSFKSNNNNGRNSHSTVESTEKVAATIATTLSSPSSTSTSSQGVKASSQCRSTFPYIKIDRAQRRHNRIHREKQSSKFPGIENVFHREEDVLLSLQLLAYLSKYPRIRDLFHTAYEKNVFSVVEKFCRRIHPNAIQYWAGVVMRNACRKDETRDGIRRCANMSCVKWESSPREFAKCRRCRKAKYCSKACQSKAWADGHRWWCIERQATNPPTTQIPQTTTAVAAPPPSQAEAAVVVDLPSTHDMTVIEQDMNEHTTNASESSESRPMLMEMGVRMEL